MGKRKSSNKGGGLLIVLVGAVALSAAIPKEVWIGAAVVIAGVFAVYLYAKSKKAQASNNDDSAPPNPRPSETSTSARRRGVAKAAARLADAGEPVSTGASQGQSWMGQ